MLCVMLLVELFSARTESQTIDEAVHIASGVSYWQTGDFRMNPEHPPLIKLIATVPLAVLGAQSFTDNHLWATWNQWEYADYFLYHNTFSVQTMLIMSRVPIMLLSIALGWWIFRASSSLFGKWGGVFSVGMYAFDPNIIAHSRYVTTDLGFTAFAFLSVFRLTKLLRRPSVTNALLFGLSFFAMAMSKFSSELLIILLIIVLVVVRRIYPDIETLRWNKIKRWLAISIPTMAIAAFALYGFDMRKPADDPRINQLYSQRLIFLGSNDPSALPPLERFVITRLGDRGQSIGKSLERLGHARIPMYSLVRGAITVIGHNIGGQASYVLGHYGDRGWWYYFPLAIAVKTPLPTIIAFISVVVFGCAWWMRSSKKTPRVVDRLRRLPFELVLYTVLPLLFLLFSVGSRLNLGWRHMMPLYPFIFVLLGSLTLIRSNRFRLLAILVPIALTVNMMIIQIGVFPNELGYFNALVGGSTNGPRYLLDSNLDWGQDLPKLASYVRNNNIESLPFAYYGRATVTTYVPQARQLPSTEELRENTDIPQGIVAISIGELFRSDNKYSWLHDRQPYRVIGSSIYLYHIN